MQGPQDAGMVTGRVTTLTSQGIGNAFVAIVNASNTSQAFYVCLTDAQGYFHFAGINHTYDSVAGTFVPRYKVYAIDSHFGKGNSNNFTVEPLMAAWAAVIINPVPSHIGINSSKNRVFADSNDQVTISACITDFAGNPVADNTPIIFTSNAGTSYVPGMGNFRGSPLIRRRC